MSAGTTKRTPSFRRAAALAVGICALVLGPIAGPAAAQPQAPGDIRGLRPGLYLGQLPAEGYFAHACGSDGGPPLKAIAGWTAFKDCAPDARGRREIYVEYDDELAVLLRGNPDLDPRETHLYKFAGTKLAGHPIVLSVLLDAAGIVQGLRAVTDPRADLADRRRAYFLRNAVRARYGQSGWTCTQLPLDAGETPVGEFYIKERCQKIADGERRIVMTTSLYRRAGQRGVDAAGNFVAGEFVSSGRLEIWSLAASLP